MSENKENLLLLTTSKNKDLIRRGSWTSSSLTYVTALNDCLYVDWEDFKV